MYGSIMHKLHIEAILVHVNNPVKYPVYHPMAGEVCWDVEVMKCYFLPLSPLLEPPQFCSWSGTEVSAVLLIPGLDKLGRQAGRPGSALITHFLFLNVPRTCCGRTLMTGNSTAKPVRNRRECLTRILLWFQWCRGGRLGRKMRFEITTLWEHTQRKFTNSQSRTQRKQYVFVSINQHHLNQEHQAQVLQLQLS